MSEEKNDQQKKPVRRWVGIGIVVAIVLALLVYFLPVIRVSDIQVEGAVNADAKEITATSEIAQSENILRLDTDRAAQRVSSLPWIKRVTVARSFPSTVKIQIEEHQPVGVLKKDGEPLVVDKEGNGFLSGIEPDGAVPFDKVKVDDTVAIKAAAKAVVALTPENRDALTKVEAPSAEEITMVFSTGENDDQHDGEDKTIYWGSADRANEKAEATRIVLGREEPRWNISNPAMPSTKLL